MVLSLQRSFPNDKNKKYKAEEVEDCDVWFCHKWPSAVPWMGPGRVLYSGAKSGRDKSLFLTVCAQPEYMTYISSVLR